MGQLKLMTRMSPQKKKKLRKYEILVAIEKVMLQP